jgi:hypothetical protein
MRNQKNRAAIFAKKGSNKKGELELFISTLKTADQMINTDTPRA